MVKIKILKVNLKKLSQNIEENGSKGWLVVGGGMDKKIRALSKKFIIWNGEITRKENRNKIREEIFKEITFKNIF